jgi:predicted N-acetyltransferase YhbS
MENPLTLRKEMPDDYPAVFQLNHRAFKQDGEAKLVQALRNNPEVFVPELSIVALFDGELVGHILFTKIEIKNEQDISAESLALAPMAVRPDHQKMGIGGQLIRLGLRTAADLGFRSVIVLGHEHYYPRFGFEPAEKWKIKAPFEVPSSAFMAIELVPDGLRNCSGTVVYPQEFSAV